MLHGVKASESNPPLYYVLGWGWAKEFGTGEVGLRSLSALFGAATVPVGYLIGRQLASRRAGLILAGADRRQPDADLVLAGGPFLRAAGLLLRRSRCSSSCGRWTPAAAATSPAGRWPRRWPSAATTSPSSRSRSRRSGCWWRCGAALARSCCRRWRRSPRPAWRCCRWPTPRPTRPTSAGSKTARSPNASGRPAVSFLVGETGHVIAEAPRERYALVPIVLVVLALALLALAGRAPRAPRRGARAGAGARGRGADRGGGPGRQGLRGRAQPAAGPGAAAGGGRDRLRRRRRAPPRAAPRGRRSAPTGSPSTSTSPRRRTCSGPTSAPSPKRSARPAAARAIVTWKLAADPVRYYLHDEAGAHVRWRGTNRAKSPSSASRWNREGG